MADKIAAVIFGIVGIVNLLPVVAFFDASKTVKLYGVPIEGESLTILMRHRGALLAILGSTLIYAAFKPEFRVFAVAVALVSKLTFVFLTFTAANCTPEVGQVALVDVGAIALLLVASALHFYGK
jgi:hypothetical protein